MPWILAFHIIFVITWFAGLFYLPRLFVYHVSAADEISQQRFVVMERKLYYYIMWPSMVLTVLFGLGLLGANGSYYLAQGWMHTKLTCVVLLIIFQFFCGHYLRKFKAKQNTHSEKFFRIFNEVPSVLLIIIVIMVVVQP